MCPNKAYLDTVDFHQMAVYPKSTLDPYCHGRKTLLQANQQSIDRDWCQQYISEQVFRFQPREYSKEHPIWPGMIGLELEMHPFVADLYQQGEIRPVPLVQGDPNLHHALRQLEPEFPEWTFENAPDSEHLLRIMLEKNDQISFEPGGQLEISTIPFPCLEDAQKRLEDTLATIRPRLQAQNIELLACGSNPWWNADQIGLQMQKPRYKAMDAFFNRIGPYGRLMMRQTATLQVNLDFGSSEEQMAKRYLLANLLAPWLTASFANSAISEGIPNGYKSLRGFAWQHLDPTRTGFPELQTIIAKLDKESCVDAYFSRIMKQRVVFFARDNYAVPDEALNFDQWLADSKRWGQAQRSDFETHLSLYFPEVRARGFLELRSIDAQSTAWLAVPACFCTGLLYDETSLDAALDLLLPIVPRLQEFWQQCVHGLASQEMQDYAVKIGVLAQEGFHRLPSCYHGGYAQTLLDKFLNRFTLRGRCPADDVLDALSASAESGLTPKLMSEIEARWLEESQA